MNEEISFGRIVKEHRHARDLTQAELARRVACAAVTVRKIEADALRPSQQIAERLAMALAIPQAEQTKFVRLARAASLVDRAPPPLPTPPPGPEEVGQKDLSGRAIRGYQLGERIAVGGFGAVYRAIQPYVEREVAIKIILPQYADHPDFIRRFETEAQLVAGLEHPYIVPLYDYWREPGSAYLVMRLMRGGSLQTKLKEGPLALDITLRLLQQIGDALYSAHRAGVIHRDIKPANILLDEDDNAYLADFGFAKNLGQAILAEQTQAGTIIGSLEYISPEQIQADRVRAQSDIYCLGIMLYEMLTGHKPFQGVTPVDYIKQHLTEPLPPLSGHYPDPKANQGMLAALDVVLCRATAKNPSERYANVVAMLAEIQEIVSLAAVTAIAIRRPVGKDGQPAAVMHQLDVESPYKGLRAFGEADAADFFGRETLIQTLLGRLAGSENLATHPEVVGQELDRFLAVVGPSGSGKSSVVRAGLIPALRQGGLPDSENWFIVKMIPGTHPLEELEAALLRVAINPPESLLVQLREDERGLLRAVRRILPPDESTELVLVIDQFEEIFTLCSDEATRVHLLDSLVMAVLDPRSRLRVVITLRADFTDRPLQYVDFGELVRHRTEFVLPLTPDDMDEAIAGPAKRVGLTLEPGLTQTIIGDLGDQPGTLPLLQYTLTELFERRVGNALTLGAYQASGGVRRVLASRADKLYTELDAVGQEAVRQLFLRLITLGETSGQGVSASDTRRRVLRAELSLLDGQLTTTGEGPGKETNSSSDVRPSTRVIRPSSMMETVIDKYGRHRFLTFDRDPVTRGPTVEVAHEALIREWKRLRGWLDEDREFLLWQQRLRAAQHQWEASQEDEGAMLRGAPLIEAENWYNQRWTELNESERNFIQASLQLREQEAAERETQRQRELEAAQKLAEAEAQRAEVQTRAASQLRKRAVYLTGALLVAALLAVIAVIFGQQAGQNEQKALAQESTAVAEAKDRATAQAEAFAEAEKRATAQADAETQQKEAEYQAQIAFSRELAAAAVNSLDIDPERGVLLALHALSEAHTLEAENALHQALPTLHILHTLTGHTAGLMDVAYSPDGKYLATASDDWSVIVWEVRLAEVRQVLTLPKGSHTATVRGVAFSPDGQRLATASDDGTAKVWDVATGEELLALTEHDNLTAGYFMGAMQVDFSPDGQRLATGNLDGVPKVWDAFTGEELLALPGHTDLVADIAFSPDGTRLATSSLDNTAKIWDAASGEALFTLSGHTGWVEKLAFSPDGIRLATAGNDEVAKVWDVATGEELLTLVGHEGWVDGVAFSPDGLRLATASYDGTAKVWEVGTGRELLTLTGHKTTVIAVAFSPDGRQLATAGYDGTAKIWDTAPGREFLNLVGHTDWVEGVAFSPDGKHLASASDDNTVRVWDAASGQELFILTAEDYPGPPFRSIVFSPDGTRLAVSTIEGTVTVWDFASGKELLAAWDAHTNWIWGLTFSPDGTRIATSSLDGTAKVWDAESGRELLTLTGHTDSIWGLDYSPDGTRLATASWDDSVRVWDAATGHELLSLSTGDRDVFDVAFSPDGIHLAAGRQDGTAMMWDSVTGQELFTMSGHTGNIVRLTFSPDGRRLATASFDSTAKVWDTATGQELLTLFGNASNVVDVSFSPDGTRLATAGFDDTVHLYVLPIEELVALAQSRMTRSLTDEECQRFLHLETCPEGP